MRFDGGAAQYLELHVVGYEFQNPAGQSDGFDWDANWLVMAGQAGDGERGAWSFRDPCLLTTDARRLVAWLELVADGSPQDDALDFLEPNLEFRRVSPPGAQVILRVIFRLESRPPWAPDTADDDWDAAYLDFDISPDALRRAASELRIELEGYPER